MAMEKAIKTIKPGMRDFEMMSLAQHTVQNLGSEQLNHGCHRIGPFRP
jgi:hypothetical protein